MLASVKRILTTLLVIYLVMLAALYFGQRSMVFKPRGDMDAPATYGLQGYDEIALPTADGLSLRAWYSKPEGAKKAILFFGGNTDELANYIQFFKQLREADVAVLGVCYRGYCGSEGDPTEQGLYVDADTGLEFLRKDFADADIIVMGRSLGTGVATNLAHKNELGGLVLVSPYTSLPAVGAGIYWYMPVQLLMKDKFDSIEKIAAVSAPVLIIHGDQDKLIPLSHAIALDSRAKSKKQLKIYKGVAHNDVPFTRVGKDLLEFIGNE